MFSRKRRSRAPWSARPWLEALEIRLVPAGTWTQLNNNFPDLNGPGTMLLMPNGQVMVSAEGTNKLLGSLSELSNSWYTLNIDAKGSYQNGSWNQLTSSNLARLFYSSNVLPDGRLFVLGGEYWGLSAGTFLGEDTTSGEIYDPKTNTWTKITPIPNASGLEGNGPSEVLPDGRVLVGDTTDAQTWIYNPATDKWIQGPTKLYDDESLNETWIKLGEGTVLSYDAWGYYNHYDLGDPRAIPYEAQKYIPSTTGGIGEWVDAGNVGNQLETNLPPLLGADPFNLIEGLPYITVGPGLQLANGKVFQIGAYGNTALYTPGPDQTDSGSWSSGPEVPPIFNGNIPPDSAGANNAPAVELPDGHILFAVDDVTFPADIFGLGQPTLLYDYNPATNKVTPVATPAGLTNELNNLSAAEMTRMIVLPTGQVLLNDGNADMWLYTPSDAPLASSVPTISYISAAGGNTFTLQGTLLNGISEGASFNSNSEQSENFPLVQLTDTHGDVYYAPTSNWSSEWVSTGIIPETTTFTVPSTPGPGAYLLNVISDGISSATVLFIDMGPGANNLTVRLNDSDLPYHNIQILQNDNDLLSEFPQTSFGDTYVIGNSSDDTLTIDGSGGDPVPTNYNTPVPTKYNFTYEGNTSSDTLVGPDQTNTWQLNSANAGTLNGDITFTNVANITGGSGDDDFVFQSGSEITGEVNGGGGTGFDTIDVSNVTINTMPPTDEEVPTPLSPGSIKGFSDPNGAPPAITGSFDNIDFIATAGTHLEITQQPANTVVGNPFSFQVAVKDAAEQINKSYTGPLTVSLENNPSGATLSGKLTVNAVAGVATFSGLFLDLTGSPYRLIVTSPIIDPQTTNNFSISPNVPTKVVVTTQPPTSVTAGAGFGLTLKAEDNNGFVALTYNGKATISLVNNPGGSVLGGTLTANFVNGVATFSGLTLNKAATGYTFQVAGTTPITLAAATTTPLNVVAGSATQLVLNPQPPTTIAAGDQFGFTVYAEDAFGNVDLTFVKQVSAALTPSIYTGTLSGNTTVTAIHGVANFVGLTLNLVGTTTIDVSASGLPTTTSSNSDISVVPGQQVKLIFLTNPPANISAGSTIGGATGIVVLVEDAEGNLATQFNGNVSVAMADSATGDLLQNSGVFQGVHTVAANAGVATFSNLSMILAGTGYEIISSGSELTPASSTPFNVSALAATQLGVTLQPANVTAGTLLNVVVAGEDSYGNVDPTFTGNITLALGNDPTGGKATLGGTLTQTASGGLATFGDLQITSAASGYTLQATSLSLPAAPPTFTNSFNIAAGSASQLAVTSQPGNVSVFKHIVFTVSAEDPYGNVDPNFVGTMNASIGNNAGGGILTGTISQSAAAGVAVFPNLELNKPGTGYTLRISDAGLQTTTNPFNVAAGNSSQLAVTTQPASSVTAGSAFTVAVSAEDSTGNVDPTFTGDITLSLATNPGGSTLGGTLTVAAVNGVATFSNLTLNFAANGYKLQASNGTWNATTSAFSVAAAPATQLVVTSQPPASIVAGTGFGFTVKAEDANGNVDPTFNSNVTVTVSTNPGSSSLAGNITVTAIKGVATFSGLSLNKADPGYILAAGSGTLTQGLTSAIAVTPGTANQFVVTTAPPGSVTAGTAFGYVVSAEDANGNVDPTFSSNVTVILLTNPGSSTLGGAVTVQAQSGVATFSSLTLNKIGTGYTLQASSGGLTSSASSPINVTAGAATQLVVTGQPPSSVTAGQGFGFTVKAEDANGNVDPTFNASLLVSLSNNPGGSTLGSSFSQINQSGVIILSGLTLNKSDPGYVLQVGSGTLAKGFTNPVTVKASSASQFVVTTQPANVKAGAAITVVVAAEDSFGNVDTTYGAGITAKLASNPGVSTLNGTLAQSAVGGVATFANLTLNRPGIGYTLQFTNGGLSATTNGFNVSPAAASHLVVTSEPPSSVIPNTGFGFVVSAVDPFGNLDTNFTNNVSASLITNPGGSTLGGNATVQAVGGIATFSSLTLNVDATGYVLQASSGSLNPDTTTAFSVTPGQATKLVVSSEPPASVTAGSGFGFTVQAQDIDGNVDPTFTGNVTVTFSNNPGGSTLGGAITVPASNGIATFAGLTLNKAAPRYVLQVGSGTLTSASTSAITVTGSKATQLVLTSTPPASVTAGAGFGFTVSAEDTSGNIDPTFNGNVTVALAANPGGSNLGGQTTVAAINGVATFAGLTLNKAGTGYNLQATSGILTPAPTGTISVTAGAATQLVVTTQPPANVLVNSGFGLTVSAEDANGNIDPTYNLNTGNLTLALLANPGNGTLGGSVTVQGQNGVATISGLTIDQAGNGYTIKVTSGSLSAGVSAGFNEVSGVPITTASLSGTSNGSGWYQGNVTVTLTAFDPIFPLNVTTYYQVDGGSWTQYTAPFLVGGDGTHTVNYRSQNSSPPAFENTETTTFQIDTTAPTTLAKVTGMLGSGGWYKAPATVALTASDVFSTVPTTGGHTTSGVATTYYTLDGGSPFVYTAPVQLGDGNHIITYYSVDVAGNVEGAHQLNVKVDSTPPVTTATLTGTQGNAGFYTSAVKVMLNPIDNASGPASTYYRLSLTSAWTLYHPGSTITVSKQGSTTIYYYSIDLAGNKEAVESTSFKIDSVPPALTVHVTAATANNVKSVPVSGTSEVGALISITVTDTNGNVVTVSTTAVAKGAWSANFSALGLADGVLTIQVTATDAAGNHKTVTQKTTMSA